MITSNIKKLGIQPVVVNNNNAYVYTCTEPLEALLDVSEILFNMVISSKSMPYNIIGLHKKTLNTLQM